ncbi:somatomedin-B and thrombospondin type-1 domain-containing protein-like [Felis catus]|uniref:somatomedin-B and thrombospondin type-1 domain-containing protein-like n=1 Tax=Felis catus TaxID=9685 RepID=UPI001D19FDE7|nr:somatomedin-B and thrombospondin type-1 domain-containing protein-like [Felis catus]
MPATMCLVLLLLLWLSCATPNQETGSCSQPQPLCCFGTDHHCKRGSCYCDEFCHEVSDCCPDHRALCTLGNSHAGSFPPLAEPDAVMDRGKPLACTSGQGQDVDWMPPEGPDNPEILTFGPFLSQNTKMVLQMVLRRETPPSPARSNLDWIQNVVSTLVVLPEGVLTSCSCLPGL